MPFKAPENPKCPKCGKSVYHAEARVVGDISFHKECYKCSKFMADAALFKLSFLCCGILLTFPCCKGQLALYQKGLDISFDNYWSKTRHFSRRVEQTINIIKKKKKYICLTNIPPLPPPLPKVCATRCWTPPTPTVTRISCTARPATDGSLGPRDTASEAALLASAWTLAHTSSKCCCCRLGSYS